MFKAVYFHRTVRSAGIMVAKAMDLTNDIIGFTTFKDPEEFSRLVDHYVIYSIQNSSSKADEVRKAQELIHGFLNRKLLKCAFEVLLYHDDPIYSSLLKKPAYKEQLEEQVAREGGLERNSIFMDVSTVPSLPYHLSGQGDSEGSEILVVTKDGGAENVTSLFELSPLAKSLRGFVDVARFYTTQENRNKAAIAARDVFERGQPYYSRRSV
jgi:HD superfamily phosphohydrolase